MTEIARRAAALAPSLDRLYSGDPVRKPQPPSDSASRLLIHHRV
jgi:hypothetical protein